MKVISNNTKDDRKVMFDTSSMQILEFGYPAGGYHLQFDINTTASAFYRGTKSQVREMFDAIVAAEKHGDKFFEINW